MSDESSHDQKRLPLPPDLEPEPALKLPETQTHRSMVFGVVGSNIFGLFIAGIYEYLSLRGVINVSVAWLVLSVTWILALVGIGFSEWAWGHKLKHRLVIFLASAILLAILLAAIDRAVSTYVVQRLPQTTSPGADNPHPPGPSVGHHVQPNLPAVVTPAPASPANARPLVRPPAVAAANQERDRHSFPNPPSGPHSGSRGAGDLTDVQLSQELRKLAGRLRQLQKEFLADKQYGNEIAEESHGGAAAFTEFYTTNLHKWTNKYIEDFHPTEMELREEVKNRRFLTPANLPESCGKLKLYDEVLTQSLVGMDPMGDRAKCLEDLADIVDSK